MLSRIIAILSVLLIPCISNAQVVCPKQAIDNNNIVKHIGPMDVRQPRGQTGGKGEQDYIKAINKLGTVNINSGLILRIKVKPANEYYLDYSLWNGPFDFESGHSGKLPGLAGGSLNAGCKKKWGGGWSARQHFFTGGKVGSYLYYQGRKGTCGDTFMWDSGKFKLSKNKLYRITQRVKVNTPGKADGVDEIWVDGNKVLDKKGIRWRGDVSPSTAMVDQVLYHSYSGGKSVTKAPKFDSYARFCDMYVMSCEPDFDAVPGTCK